MDTKTINARTFTLGERTVRSGIGPEVTLREQTITLGEQKVTLDEQVLTLGRREVTLGVRTVMVGDESPVDLRKRVIILGEQKVTLDGPGDVMAVISEQKVLDEQAIIRRGGQQQKVVTLSGVGLMLGEQTVRLDRFSVNGPATLTVILGEQKVTFLGGEQTISLDEFASVTLNGGDQTITLGEQEFTLKVRP